MAIPDLETLLRAAPQPAPPAGLARRLREQVVLPGKTLPTPAQASGKALSNRPGASSWWWLGLLAGGIAIGSAAMVWQQGEIRQLQAQMAEATRSSSSVVAPSVSAVPSEDPHAEIERLRAEVAQRLADAEAARRLAAEVVASAGQNPAGTQPLAAEDLAAMDAARARALSIRCINNLKQIGLGIRVFATDHGDKFPAEFSLIQSELGTPKVLTCPADPAREPAADWTMFSPANASYEYLAPDGSENDHDYRRVLTRCTVHGHVGLCDGSVQMNTTNRVLRVVNRQGKLYLE